MKLLLAALFFSSLCIDAAQEQHELRVAWSEPTMPALPPLPPHAHITGPLCRARARNVINILIPCTLLLGVGAGVTYGVVGLARPSPNQDSCFNPTFSCLGAAGKKCVDFLDCPTRDFPLDQVAHGMCGDGDATIAIDYDDPWACPKPEDQACNHTNLEATIRRRMKQCLATSAMKSKRQKLPKGKNKFKHRGR